MDEGGVNVAHSRRGARRRPSRRRRLLTHGGPVVVLAVAAFLLGTRLGGDPRRAERRLVTGYVSAWTHGDVPQMYDRLDRASRARGERIAVCR